jgi:hypothetical protein
MRPIIYLILFICLCINSFFSQESLDSKLLTIEEKIYTEINDTMANDLVIEKVNLLLKEEKYDDRILNEIKRVKINLMNNEIVKSSFLWNASLISYLNAETYTSLYYFNLYQNLENDSSIQVTLLNFLINSGYNDLKADEYLNKLIIQDSLFNSLVCFNEVQRYELKHKKVYGVLGMLLPGAGLIVNKEYRKGVTSMGLNTATVLAITWFAKQNLYLNMFGWGSNLITKFYLGGLNLTEKTVLLREASIKEKLATNCELQLKYIVEKYPLELKK